MLSMWQEAGTKQVSACSCLQYQRNSLYRFHIPSLVEVALRAIGRRLFGNAQLGGQESDQSANMVRRRMRSDT